jgi:hypothetical protein
MKSFWLAVLAYVLPTFPLGYIWHLVAFHEQYERLALYRAEVLIPLGLSSMVIQGVVFAWIYPRLLSTKREDWLRSALKFFGMFSVLAWSFTTLPVAAKYQMTSVPNFMMLETAFALLQFAVASPLVALAYRETRPAAATALA